MSGGDESIDEADIDGHVAAPDAYSAAEALRHRDFDRMTPAELRDAERLVDLLAPRLELRRTRRYELHHHGRLLAPRAMFRRNLATGGQLTEWVWRRTVKRPRKIVVLCDISGSMERHSRLLLRFVQALVRVVGGQDGVVRVRDEAHARDAAAARPRPGPRPRARRRRGHRLGRRDADRRVVPRVQPALGAPDAADERHRHRRVGRLGPRRSGARRDRDGAPPAQLPPARLAQPAGRHARLRAARRRDAGGLPVHRRLPAGRHRRQPRAPRRDPRRRPLERRPAGRGGGGLGRCRRARRRDASRPRAATDGLPGPRPDHAKRGRSR